MQEAKKLSAEELRIAYGEMLDHDDCVQSNALARIKGHIAALERELEGIAQDVFTLSVISDPHEIGERILALSVRLGDRLGCTADAARITGLTERGVQAMAARGALPGAVKVGNGWRFDVAKLEAWVRRGGSAVAPEHKHLWSGDGPDAFCVGCMERKHMQGQGPPQDDNGETT